MFTPPRASEDEHRFIRYAVARLGAFFNITWDLGDDLDVFATKNGPTKPGMLIEQWDPYHHLATSHPDEDDHSRTVVRVGLGLPHTRSGPVISIH